MTSAAVALNPAPQEPDEALRGFLVQLAGSTCTLPRQADSFEALCMLLVQAVSETLLPRTYLLESPNHSGLQFSVSNRRVLSFFDIGSQKAEPFPDAPSSEVAKLVMERLIAAFEQSQHWTLRLTENSRVVTDGGGSCSGAALLRVADLGPDQSAGRPAAPQELASLSVPKGVGQPVAEGDPALVTVLERVAEAFLPHAFGPAVAGSMPPQRNMIIPISKNHIALISTKTSCYMLQAFATSDMEAVAGERELPKTGSII